MNNDLISRSELKKAIKSYADDQYAENEYLGECAIMAIIDNAPTVTLTKNQAYDKGFITAMKLYARPKGEWIKDNSGERFCSECGSCALYHEIGTQIESQFCPNCGAWMGKGESEK